MDFNDPQHSRFESKYSHLPLDVIPAAESLKLTVERVLPYWFDIICPEVKDGKDVLVVAHGNSLRAIVKYLSKMNKEEIIKYNIPTGVPFVYEFDKDLKPIANFYLLNDAELKARQEAVANQGKAH